MKVRNMESAKGNKIANQIVIEDCIIDDPRDDSIQITGNMFQSYDSNICFVWADEIFLDEKYWDYSNTTGKYRNLFLDETKAETQKKIDSGEYVLCNLN